MKVSLIFVLTIAHFTAAIKAQTYGSLPMGGAGFVSGIVTSKSEANLMYARTDVGGAYRWNQDSAVWEPLTDWVSSSELGYLGVESLAMDPSDPDKLYMAVGTDYFNSGKSAILRSSDRGKTFQKTVVTTQFKIHGNGMGRNTGEKLAVDPNMGQILYYGSRSNGLFQSTTAGETWTRLNQPNITTTTSGNGFSFVVIDPNSAIPGNPSQTIIAAVSRTGDNFYRSDDGGLTFNVVSGGPSLLMPMRATLAGNGVLYITYADKEGPWNPGTGQIWKYELSSGIWTNITPAGYILPYGGISVDPNNPDRLVASTINVYRSQGNNQWGDLIFVSNNGGTSWVNKISAGFKIDPFGIEWAKSGISIHWAGSIEFDPFNTKRVFVISGNGIFRTDDIDANPNIWMFDVKGIEESVPMDMVSLEGGPVLSAIGDYDGFRHTDRTKYPKRYSPSMGTTLGIAFAAQNPKVVVRTGEKLYYSEDTAKTWTLGNINGKQGYCAVSADGKIILHSPTETITNISYRSTDKGKTWTTVTGLTTQGTRIVADPVNSKVFYSLNTGSGKMMVSIDGGVSFFGAGQAGSGGSKHIRTVPGYEGHIWVALYNGGLKRSVDYGASFTKLANLTSCSAVGFGKAAPGASYPTIFVLGVVQGIEGLYFSTDEGVTWNRINDDAHQWGGAGNGQFVCGDMNETGIVYMSTAGRGIVWVKADYMLSPGLFSIPVGDSVQISTTVLNGDTIKWNWESLFPLIASVDTNGLVHGISPGKASIIATGEGRTLYVSVTVATPVTSLSVNPETDTIPISTQVQFTVTQLPEDATNTHFTWSSVNPAVATVGTTGFVKGIKAGTTLISVVSDDNRRYSFSVVVVVPVSGISLAPLSDTLDITEQKQLSAIISPAGATNGLITWSSDDPLIASVNEAGLVTAVSKGKAVITATSVDGGFEASCEITVTEFYLNAKPSNADQMNISVYPNPLKGNELTIDLGGLSGMSIISIIDCCGGIVEKQYVSGKQLFNMETVLDKGLYLVRVENEGKLYLRKLVVD
jgi:uncharacterized protein YjdB